MTVGNEVLADSQVSEMLCGIAHDLEKGGATAKWLD